MADSYIQVPTDSSGKRVDAESLTVGALTVQRQRVQVAGAADVDLAPVDATYGLSVDVARTVDPDVADRALRDCGKVDVAALDQYAPEDVDTGGGTLNALPVVLKTPAAGGASLGVAATPMRVDPTGTTTQPVSIGAALPAGGNNIGDVDVLTLPGVAGDVAHDGADSGNPVKVGGRAVTALPTPVSANDRTNLLTDVYGRVFVRAGNQGPNGNLFAVQHTPAVNVQATIGQAGAGVGIRNVCTGIQATFAAGATAPTAVQVFVQLRDGASGVGTVIWSATLALPAVAGAVAGIALTNLWILGTVNTVLTLEFSAAGGANTYEVVSMQGVMVAE